MFFKCQIKDCEKVFNCKKALKEHERTHDQNRPFKWLVKSLDIYVLAINVIKLARNTHPSKNMRESMVNRSHINVILKDACKLLVKYLIS